MDSVDRWAAKTVGAEILQNVAYEKRFLFFTRPSFRFHLGDLAWVHESDDELSSFVFLIIRHHVCPKLPSESKPEARRDPAALLGIIVECSLAESDIDADRDGKTNGGAG